MCRGVAHKIPPHIVGKIDHLLRYFSRNFREHTVQQVTFNFCFGIAHFHQHEAVHEGDVLTHDSLIKPGFVAVAIGVGRHDEAEHGAWLDQFSTIFSNTERRTVENGVQSNKRSRRAQIGLIEQEYAANLHGQSKRSILKDHVAVLYG